jgi:TonB family protein
MGKVVENRFKGLFKPALWKKNKMKPGAMSSRINTLSIAVLCLLISAGEAQVQRYSGEVINTTMIWSGTIVIAGDVTIESNGRLEIEPGTQILFEPNTDLNKGGEDKTRAELVILGTVIARGLAGKRIVFSSRSSDPRMGDWYGLTFMHLKSGSILDYCVVEYAYTGITIKNSSMIVGNCEIRYNYHAGIKTEVKAKPTIKNNILSDNGYAGLICELGANPILTENLISLNRIGVVAFSLSQPNFGSLAQDVNYNPGHNTIFNNEEYDFYNHSTKTIQAENNSWGDESIAVISEKLYDRKDNDKFGEIDFLPLMTKSGTSGQDNIFLLTQNRAAEESPTQVAAKKPGPAGIDSGLALSQKTGESLRDQITNEEHKINDKLVEANPLIASNSPSRQVFDPSSTPNAAAQRIDYDQVFLELFLDGGAKHYKEKPKLRISNVLQNVLTPGEIRIRVIVARSGRVDQASVLKGINDILDEAVLETVKKYRYKAGTVNGQPVKFSTSEVFRFK